MWEKLRKTALIVAVFASVISSVMLIETGKFESPAGLFLVIINIAYMALFTYANGNRN